MHPRIKEYDEKSTKKSKIYLHQTAKRIFGLKFDLRIWSQTGVNLSMF